MAGMTITPSDGFVHCVSPWLSLAFARGFPFVAQFGVESGGRLRRHVEGNLLKPGLGMASVDAGRTSFRRGAAAELVQGGIAYRGGEGLDWQVSFRGERGCVIRLRRPGGRIGGEFWRMSFSPAVCPVSVWGEPVAEPDFPPSGAWGRTPFDASDIRAEFRAPVLMHFPDHGSVRLDCSAPGAIARQTLIADRDEVGLTLGCHNTGYHTRCVAFHRGTIEVALALGEGAADLDEVDIELTVEPEIAPRLPGVDLSGSRWDGLRRTWLNAFALGPATLTMGDNLLLHGVAHLAIHYKSDQARFTPPLLPGLDLHRFLGRALRLTFASCVGPQGHVAAGYAERGRREPPGFDFFEGGISSLIALRNHVAATGDWAIAAGNGDALARVGRFLLSFDADGDGVLEMPYHGNGFAPDRVYRNWWDNFPFGHKDAWVNLLAHRALGDLAELLDGLGRAGDAAPLRAWRARFAAAFHRVFYNPATGAHAGWISADGRVHDYGFTFISAMAINQGLIDGDLAREILGRMIARLRAAGYGSWAWGIPGPLEPVTEADGHIWAPMQRWGSYENGGCCGMTAYHFVQALYAAGMREQADEILFSLLATFEREPTHSGLFPGYMRSVDWRSREGYATGYNYLADNYHLGLAGITGHHGAAAPPLPPCAGS